MMLNRFWQRLEIPLDVFMAICKAVDLEDWREITELTPEITKPRWSTLRSKMVDAELLKASLRDLGITVKTYADVRGRYGARVRADIVAVLEGEFDIGFSRNSDGAFDLIADLWGVAKKHNQTELINTICQKYAVNKTLAEVKQRGFGGKTKCPRCSSTQINKHAYSQGKQNYICRNCGTQFGES